MREFVQAPVERIPLRQRKIFAEQIRKNGEKVSAKKGSSKSGAPSASGSSRPPPPLPPSLGQEPPASVIVVDPALRFKVRSENGQDRSAENHYPCGTVEEMIALKPPMADDVAVFIWTSGPNF
jgi:hypothetical protein